MLECVMNVSEGQNADVLAALVAEAGDDLLDVHSDADHHRSVLTLVGEEAPRRVAARAVAALDLRTHQGAHPRIGVVDVVPFVPLGSAAMADAVAARDRFAAWAGDTLGVPCFLYGPGSGTPVDGQPEGGGGQASDGGGGRTLPELRRGAWRTLRPDVGPDAAHPTAGAMAVGARRVLVAYNVWLAEPDLEVARAIAASLRSPAVRTLGLVVGSAVQVSMNLVEPLNVGPAEVFDAVARRAPVARAELVGLVPEAVLDAVPEHRWPELDLAADRTIEARLARRTR